MSRARRASRARVGGGSPFKGRSARLLYDLHHGPNMTPMVDVVMVLLIFFMATASLLGPEVLLGARMAEPPDVASESAAAEAGEREVFRIEPPSFEVSLRIGEGGVRVTGLGLSDAPLASVTGAAAQLAERLGAVDDIAIVITATDDTPYEAVVRVNEACRAAGFEGVGVR